MKGVEEIVRKRAENLCFLIKVLTNLHFQGILSGKELNSILKEHTRKVLQANYELLKHYEERRN